MHNEAWIILVGFQICWWFFYSPLTWEYVLGDGLASKVLTVHANPWSLSRKPDMMAYAYNPSSLEEDTEGALELAEILENSVSSRYSEGSCLK